MSMTAIEPSVHYSARFLLLRQRFEARENIRIENIPEAHLGHHHAVGCHCGAEVDQLPGQALAAEQQVLRLQVPAGTNEETQTHTS
jgi:hypothetical protein